MIHRVLQDLLCVFLGFHRNARGSATLRVQVPNHILF